MILVVGATGLLGMAVCAQLRGQGKSVRALVRAGSPQEATLRGLGVDIVHGDLASLIAVEHACAGVTAIVSTATAMGSKRKGNLLRTVDRDGQLLLVNVAKRNAVGHFVFISLSPNLKPSAPLVRYKREVAAAVRQSGMHWTILQPSVFMEVWLGKLLGWDFANAQAMIFGSGAAPLSWISLHDVARYAVLAIDDPRLRDRDLPLGGPAAISPNDVVEIFEGISGRRYKAKRAPRRVLAMLSPIVSLFDDRLGSGMSLGAQCALGDEIDSPLQDDIGLKLTSVREYAQSVIAGLR